MPSVLLLLLSPFGNIFSLENTFLGKHQHLPITSDQGTFCDSNAGPCSTPYRHLSGDWTVTLVLKAFPISLFTLQLSRKISSDSAYVRISHKRAQQYVQMMNLNPSMATLNPEYIKSRKEAMAVIWKQTMTFWTEKWPQDWVPHHMKNSEHHISIEQSHRLFFPCSSWTLV